jgi:CheY-like chemotaxis protein
MTIAGEAANGVEAIEQAKQVQPDIVLLDLMMPRWAAWRRHRTSSPLARRRASLS